MQNCPCRGRNPQCFRCGGSGMYEPVIDSVAARKNEIKSARKRSKSIQKQSKHRELLQGLKDACIAIEQDITPENITKLESVWNQSRGITTIHKEQTFKNASSIMRWLRRSGHITKKRAEQGAAANPSRTAPVSYDRSAFPFTSFSELGRPFGVAELGVRLYKMRFF